MALATYAQLVDSVQRWLHRDDLAADVPDFIRMAEEAISADLADCQAMLRSPAPIALSPAATAFSLPSDAFTLISARLVETGQHLRVVPVQTLKRREGYAVTGAPTACSVTGSSDDGALSVSVWPVPEVAYTVQVTYAAAVPTLDGSTRTANFVLTRAPSLYLYGALLASAPYLGKDQRIATWQTLYAQALDRFKSLAWGGDVAAASDVPGVGAAGFNVFTGE